jgi:ubiquinone/menaquinone biosynthesis C-methylase UbiE
LFSAAGKIKNGDGSLNMKVSAISAEAERVRKVYAERLEVGNGPIEPFRMQIHHERQERLLRFFHDAGLASLRNLNILEVGCGTGGNLRRLTDFGADPQRCFGIDLYQKSLREARYVNPNISFAEANAAQLPFADNTFDLAFQFTVMTSVLDTEVRQEIASEIRRVLRTGGYLVWYDFAYSNPRNPTVRGISRNEIRDLLSGFRLQFSKITLAPPLGRPAAKVSPTLYRILSAIPLLRTHYFCFAQKI